MKVSVRKLIILLFMLILPNFVYASEVEFKCPSEVVVGSNVLCHVNLNTDTKVKGIMAKYKYDDVFSYVRTINSAKWELLAGNVNGMSLVSLDGINGTGNIAMVTFVVSSEAKIGSDYAINLKDVALSDGSKDINVGNLNSTVKVVGIKDIFKSIMVNDKEVLLSDGIVNSIVEVDYDTESVDIKATLNNEDYSFDDRYGPKVIDNLNVGDNEVYLRVMNGDMDILTYHINVKRLPKVEANVSSNPKTGLFSLFVVGLIFVISIFTLFGVERHITKGGEI